MLRLDQLVAHPANVREEITDLDEMANSIREHGILQPLLVTEHPTDPDRFLILAGHRRAKAARKAGLQSVPCVIRFGLEENRDEQLVVMLVENCQRTDLSPLEQAEALAALRARGVSGQELARRTGKSQAWVSYRLGILDLTEGERRALASGDLNVAEAEAIVREKRKRGRGGKTVDRAWEPPYFMPTHPLAKKAERLCNARGHNLRRRVGKVACGQCWERVIRDDERTVLLADEPDEAAS